VRPRRLGHEEHAEDVGLEGAAELVLVDLRDVLGPMLLAGIVDEDVEAAELVDSLLKGLLAKLLVADIAGDGQRFPPFVLDNLLGLVRIVVLAKDRRSKCRRPRARTAPRPPDRCRCRRR